MSNGGGDQTSVGVIWLVSILLLSIVLAIGTLATYESSGTTVAAGVVIGSVVAVLLWRVFGARLYSRTDAGISRSIRFSAIGMIVLAMAIWIAGLLGRDFQFLSLALQTVWIPLGIATVGSILAIIGIARAR